MTTRLWRLLDALCHLLHLPAGRVCDRVEAGVAVAVLHVVPVADEIAHDTATDEPDCVCGPRVQPVTRDDGSIGWLLVHHALDGRERSEQQS